MAKPPALTKRPSRGGNAGASATNPSSVGARQTKNGATAQFAGRPVKVLSALMAANLATGSRTRTRCRGLTPDSPTSSRGGTRTRDPGIMSAVL